MNYGPIRRLGVVALAAAGLTLAISASRASQAISPETCRPTIQVMAQIASLPHIGKPRQLSGKAAELAMAIFNSAPPESDVAFDAAYAVEIADSSGMILVEVAGSICGALHLPAERWQTFLRSIGEGAA